MHRRDMMPITFHLQPDIIYNQIFFFFWETK